MCSPMNLSRSWKPGVAVLALAVVTALLWGAIWRSENEGRPAAGGSKPVGVPVELQPVEARRIEDTIRTVGTLVAGEAVVLTTEAAGRVESTRFEEGDRVEAGELLVLLESEKQRKRLTEARMRVAETRRERERQERLHEQDVVSMAALDEARTAHARARAELQAAIEALDDRRIEAPFDGVSGRRLISPGALLEPGDEITRIVSTGGLDLLFEVPGDRMAALRKGLRVRATTPAWPKRPFEGRVHFVGSEVSEATRTLPLEARIPDEGGRLKPGMFMDVELVVGERRAVTIPESALLTRGPASYVFVVDEQDVAHRVPVRPGVRREGWIEIEEGLAEGDRLVVEGLQRVRDGAKVRPGDAPRKATREEAGEASRATP